MDQGIKFAFRTFWIDEHGFRALFEMCVGNDLGNISLFRLGMDFVFCRQGNTKMKGFASRRSSLPA